MPCLQHRPRYVALCMTAIRAVRLWAWHTSHESGCGSGSLFDAGSLTGTALVEVLKGMALAVDAVHARGMLHRDIKRENFVLRAPRRLCLLPRILQQPLVRARS